MGKSYMDIIVVVMSLNYHKHIVTMFDNSP
jgi:hypothetical protein